MSLKEKLSNTTRGNKSVTKFLQEVKIITDQLALVRAPLDDNDITLHCLNGFGSEYKEIVGAIRAREQPISFEALHEKLVEYKDFLHRESSKGVFSPITANFTQKNKSRNGKVGNQWLSNIKNNFPKNPNSKVDWSKVKC